MTGPGWLNDVFAAFMLAVAGYAAARVITAARLRRITLWDIDLAHVPMGVAMAGMFAPRLTILPWWVWGIVFGLLTVYFLARSVVPDPQRIHYLPHTVHAGAMLYMELAVPGGISGMSMGTPRLPTIALVLALFMVGYVVVLAQGLDGPRTAPVGIPSRDPLDPRGAATYKLVTSVGMGLMLILLL